MEITRDLIRTLAPDSGSISDGEGLVRKNKFIKLHVDKDGSIIFGECAGSGKNPYYVSVDFIDAASPVPRCNCPSRKFPCKHAVGLMLAYADGRDFSVAEIPADVLSKREKIEKRSQKKEAEVKEALTKVKEPKAVKDSPKKDKPKKLSAAQEKKLNIQIDGLNIAESLLSSIIRDGLGSVTEGTIKEIEKQAKQMGDYYLTGVQKQFLDFAAVLGMKDKEEMYSAAYEKAVFLHALLKKGKDYLSAKLADPTLLDMDSEIEALLGNVWKSKDLLDAGLAEADVQYLQLAFTVAENAVIKETDEKGYWINLNNGELVCTRNIIPKKASKHINTTDSVYGVHNIPVVYRYPGTLNRRVRWDAQTISEADAEIYSKIISLAPEDLAAVIKEVKNHIKNPLAGKNPVMLVKYKAIGIVEEAYVLEDTSGNRIALENANEEGWFDTIPVIVALGKDVNTYQACLLRFKYIADGGRLVAAPLTLIRAESMLRLSF